MCFRPADATVGGAACPECGKTITSSVPLKKCPFCKADLTAAQGNDAPSAPTSPAAPGAPKAPGTPPAP